MQEKYTKKNKIKLGFAPTRRNVFVREEAIKRKLKIEGYLKANNIDYVGIDWLNEEGLMITHQDALKVADKFIGEKVDAIFTPHCNFGSEGACGALGKLVNRPYLLWGERDDGRNAEGNGMTDAQCGLFATSKMLNRLGIPFTYVTNTKIEDPIWDRGFHNFIGAAAVAKSVRNVRIGQIGPRPDGFHSTACNEAELRERFNIEIVPVSVVDIYLDLETVMAENSRQLDEYETDLASRITIYEPGAREGVRKMAGLKIVIERWAEREELSAIAIQCWHAIRKVINIQTCFTNGELTGDGLPVCCETDVHGAITSIMMQSARLGEAPTFFTDMTIRNPENNNSELLWHCGNFPSCLSCTAEERMLTGGSVPGKGHWGIKGGDITLSRFDGMHGEYSLFIGEAKGITGQYSRGVYVWAEVNDWPLWEHKIIHGPYIHHMSGIHGKVAPILYEACKYIPGLKPDPVNPTAAEIEKYLRG